MPATPSDWRSVRNTRAGVRRMLREDGLLVEPERADPPPCRCPNWTASLCSSSGWRRWRNRYGGSHE